MSKPEEETTEWERAYIEGRRRTLLNQLAHVIQELHGLGEVPEVASLVLQHQETIATIRRLCEDFGCNNDWPDRLHLSDVIEKYLIGGIAGQLPKEARP